jgi:two-component system, OmpR family, response regulator
MPTQHILIVEDDAVLAAVLVRQLQKQGYATEVESHGARAVDRVRAQAPDAVILDGNLPGMDGFDVCRELRTSYRGVILMLTGRDGDMDRVLGLELGADDYLVKPVEPRVVAAHLKACLRRVEAAPSAGSSELRYGTFRISQADRAVHLGDREIAFTTAEFDLLWMLAENAGTVLTRDQIMAGVRRIEHDGLDRSIDMRVSRLRKRLGDDADNPRRIKTVRGKGYLFSPSDWD